MAGLVDQPEDQMPPDAEAPEGAQPPAEETGPGEVPSEKPTQTSDKGGGGLDPSKFEAKMQVPPEFKDAYTRVVAAGMKVMFDPSTHSMAMKQLQSGGGPVSERLGKSAASLIFMLAEKSKGALPPQVFVPAGSTLLVTAADFLKKSGTEPVTDNDVADGLNIMIDLILKAFKVDPGKLQNYQGKPGLVDRPAAPDEPQSASPEEM